MNEPRAETAACLIIPDFAGTFPHVHLPPDLSISHRDFNSHFTNRELAPRSAAWDLIQSKSTDDVPFETVPAERDTISLRRMVWWMRQFESCGTQLPNGFGQAGWNRLVGLNRICIERWLSSDKRVFYRQNDPLPQHRADEITTIEAPSQADLACRGLLVARWNIDIHRVLDSRMRASPERRRLARAQLAVLYSNDHPSYFQRA